MRLLDIDIAKSKESRQLVLQRGPFSRIENNISFFLNAFSFPIVLGMITYLAWSSVSVTGLIILSTLFFVFLGFGIRALILFKKPSVLVLIKGISLNTNQKIIKQFATENQWTVSRLDGFITVVNARKSRWSTDREIIFIHDGPDLLCLALTLSKFGKAPFSHKRDHLRTLSIKDSFIQKLKTQPNIK